MLKNIDWFLLMPSLMLSLIGLLILASVNPQLAKMQALFLLVSLLAFFVMLNIRLSALIPIHRFLYLGSLVFLFIPVVFGIVSRGANSWLQFGVLFIQPSELVKPFLLLTAAYVATVHARLILFKLCLLFVLPGILIFRQPDLGTTIVVAAGWFVITISKLRFKSVVILLLALLFLSLPFYAFFLKDYQRDRLVSFINPYTDPLGSGYHVIQSIIAVGSGGIEGRGLGRGSQSDLRFLPENHTDFIYASLAEAFGITGSLAVIALYAILFSRVYYLSQHVSDPTQSLWALGMMTLLAFQTLVNIGMNVGLAPITGVTLPFLSYGGSSLLSTFMTLGLINSLNSNRYSQWVVLQK